MAEMVLRARLRMRDTDLQQAIARLVRDGMPEGMLADMVRDGVRLILSQRGELLPVQPITPDDAKLVARELMLNLKGK